MMLPDMGIRRARAVVIAVFLVPGRAFNIYLASLRSDEPETGDDWWHRQF